MSRFLTVLWVADRDAHDNAYSDELKDLYVNYNVDTLLQQCKVKIAVII